jgi:hypothetical protein
MCLATVAVLDLAADTMTKEEFADWLRHHVAARG